MQQFVQTRSHNTAAKIPEDVHSWYENVRIDELNKTGVV
jgi:hypothetical protein